MVLLIRRVKAHSAEHAANACLINRCVDWLTGDYHYDPAIAEGAVFIVTRRRESTCFRFTPDDGLSEYLARSYASWSPLNAAEQLAEYAYYQRTSALE